MDNNESLEQLKKDLFLKVCETPEELSDWIELYLGIKLPFNNVSGKTTEPDPAVIYSSPGLAIWEGYKTYRDDLYKENPGYIWIANRDGAKCVKKGTKLLTKNNFLKNIEDIKIGEEIWSGKAWRPVTDWIHDGVKSSIELKAEGGWELTGSPIHRVWSISGKEYGWKHLNRLKVGDWVAINSGDFSDFKRDQESWDLGYILGAIQGDGCTTLMNKGHRVALTASSEELKNKWRDFCFKVAGRYPKEGNGKRYRDLWISSKHLCSYLKELGVEPSLSYNKKVPKYCLENSSAFLGFGTIVTGKQIGRAHV